MKQLIKRKKFECTVYKKSRISILEVIIKIANENKIKIYSH